MACSFLLIAASWAGAQSPDAGAVDAELQARIDRAIETGTKWILDRQKPDGSFRGAYGSAYPKVETALCVLALHRCGADPGSKPVERAFSWLRARQYAALLAPGSGKWRSTYGVALTMLALSERRRRGGSARPPEPDRVWMREMALFLMTSQTRDGCFAAAPTHRSGGLHSDDIAGFLSLLALREARRYGTRVEDEVFAGGLEFFLRTHVPGANGPGGWTCCEEVTGAATAGAVASLLVAKAELRDERWQSLVTGVDPAAADGLRRLAICLWSEHDRPASYGMFALAQACKLSGITMLGEHAWYAEGARHVLRHQASDGSLFKGGSHMIAHHALRLLFLADGPHRRAASAAVRPTEDSGESARPALRSRINRAVKRGVVWLSSRRTGDGTFRFAGENRFTPYVTALATLSLLRAGADPNGSGVQRTFAWLRRKIDVTGAAKHEDRRTVDCAVAILTVAERHRRSGARKLDKKSRAWMTSMAKRVISAQQPDGVWGGGLADSTRQDHRTTLLALMALDEARECGLKIKGGVFFLALRSLVQTQAGEPPTPGARWWQDVGTSVVFDDRTLTATRVASIMISKNRLWAAGSRGFAPSADTYARAGIAWLEAHHSIVCRPYEQPHAYTSTWNHANVCFQHFALERAFTLARASGLRTPRWFEEAAEHVLSTQLSSGAWHETGRSGEADDATIVDQALHLLFLTGGLPGLDTSAVTPR
jgi:hypothetical protein